MNEIPDPEGRWGDYGIRKRQNEAKRYEPKHVIGLSGGKDSTCLALLMAEKEPQDYEYICTPTGNELPALFRHLDDLEERLGKPIKRLGIGKDLYGLIDEQNMIPNYRARWCTRMLKIEPTIEYMESLPKGSTLYVGLRADEPLRAGIFGEDLTIRFPLREYNFGFREVWRFLLDREVRIPKRTDCATCFHQRLGEWWDLWKQHPEHYQQGVEAEEKIGYTFRSKERDNWPTSLKMLRAKFEAGHIPPGSTLHDDLFGEDVRCRVCSL